MKTFEEAFSTTASFVEDTSDEGIEKVEAVFQEVHSRYGSFAKQAQACDEFQIAIMCWIQSVASGGMSPGSALLSAFMAGLITGIEMEKTEV